MFRLVMPGSVTSTNTAHQRKTSPRPHLIPGVKSVEEQTVPQLKAAAQAALDGNAAGAEKRLTAPERWPRMASGVT